MSASVLSGVEGASSWPLAAGLLVAVLWIVSLLAWWVSRTAILRRAIAGTIACLALALSGSGIAFLEARAKATDPPGPPIEILGALQLIGPEDLAVLPTEPPLLLVSASDRSAAATGRADGLFLLDPKKRYAAPARLAPVDRDSCSFHPHGIDVVKDDFGRIWVFVVNHHRELELAPKEGCGSIPTESDTFDSIEIFELDPVHRTLRFEERLRDERLRSPNDIAAVDRNRFFVTTPTSDGGELWRSLAVSIGRSSEAECVGAVLEWREHRWRRVAENLCYPNGIATDGSSLWVTSSIGSGLHRIELGATSSGRVESKLQGRAAPDNLSRTADGQLLVAIHADAQRFFTSALSAMKGGPPTTSPSCVLQISPETSTESPLAESALSCEPEARAPRATATAFQVPARALSGVSSAVCVGPDLYLGQVFGRGIGRVPGGCDAKGWPSVRAAR